MQPCHLPRLPEGVVTTADLETLLVQRGAALVACDAARQLAVETLFGQHSDLMKFSKLALKQQPTASDALGQP